MWAKGFGLNDAFTFVRARKPDISPNFHFMEQLHTFERQLKNDPSRGFTPSASSSSTPSAFDPSSNTPSSATSSSSSRDQRSRYLSRIVKYTCTCGEFDCRCMQQEFLLPGIGASPDSGIEFDRWTPSDNTPK